MTNPEPNVIPINDLRSKHIGTLVAVDGIIKQASEVRPEITAATFECKSCGQRITLLQEEPHLNKPFACTNETCGSRRGFDLVIRKLIDVQIIGLEDVPEKIEYGFIQKRIPVFLQENLVDRTFQKVLSGAKVRVIGILNSAPLPLGKSGGERIEMYINANYLEIEKPVITSEDKKILYDLAANPKIYELLVKSIAPSIYGYEEVKLAIALQLFGGVQKVQPENTPTRKEIHILLVGDSQTEVSSLLSSIPAIVPDAKGIMRKGTSTESFNATLVKNEFVNGGAIEAGAVVLANNGLFIIEDIDKMNKENQNTLQRVMDQQMVTVNKANIQATLQAHAAVLASANPKFGRFDDYESILKQIDIPETLMLQFDLIFPVKDVPDKEKDERVAMHVLKFHEASEVQKPPIDADILRKYISYAIGNISPKNTKSAEKEIEKYYVGLRNKKESEVETNATFMGARQIKTLVRLSEASAKIRLSEKITKEDVKRAIDLMNNSRERLGIGNETKVFEFMFSEITTNEERIKMKILLSIIEEMQSESPDNAVPLKDVVAAAEDQGIQGAKKIIDKLKSMGEVFESKPRHIRKV